MTSFKKYLLHRIKSTWVLTAVLCLFAVIITATTVTVRHYTYYDTVFDETGNPTKEEVLREDVRVRNLDMIFFALCWLCAVIPILELGGLKNKRNADVMYSLPIDRRKMAVAHFTNGFLQILAIYLCMAITATIPILLQSRGLLHLQYLPPLMLLPIPAALFLYAYYCYLFNEANSTVDGCLFMVSGTFIPFLLVAVLANFDVRRGGKLVYNFFDHIDELQAFPFFPIVGSTSLFDHGLNNNRITFYLENEDIVMMVVWSVTGLLAAIGFYLSFGRKRVETIGDISSSWVGYKSIIPICMFAISSMVYSAGDFFVVVLGAIAAIIGYMLYRRSVKIKGVDLAFIGLGILAGFALSFIEDLLTVEVLLNELI